MYTPDNSRYEKMPYRRCGKSGLLLPAISLGLWHNFGRVDRFEHFIEIIHAAFDGGVTHFDLADNYGPPPGSAEENFGRILKQGLGRYRDEWIVSTKAGHEMWPGPYGDWGSRKHLLAGINQSLRRMGLEYVDIFYSHRPDPHTPLEETASALSDIVRQGKALYVGLSKYPAGQAQQMIRLLREAGTPCLIQQERYSLFDRHAEEGLSEVLQQEGVGLIAFSPLAQGLLTDRYLNDIPSDSRAARPTGFLKQEQVTEEQTGKARRLNELAARRGQTLAQLSLSWLLKDERVTSVLIGASSVKQLQENLKAVDNTTFGEQEKEEIERILTTVSAD